MPDKTGMFLIGRSLSAAARFRLAVVLAIILLAGFVVFRAVVGPSEEHQAEEDLRVPVANPPAEPDRPDLLQEPKIDE